MSNDPEINEMIVQEVGDALAQSAMVMYMHSPSTLEHEHRELAGQTVCVHRYTAANGRSVALYVNPASPRTLTMQVSLGALEDPSTAENLPDLKTLRDRAVVETLEHIHQLPDAPEPEYGGEA